ncbi:DUF2238 domain-containing protein [Fictibacillus fluitans]|uniref:DUF2238 domain-containing protein n=1 Tax=Fictibacillus fluitans TaxID=3058422 RepID=A0ABT8HQX7_9BACL|nr:DUF2238 domain-containing protein [Fictibacillus sp. NE201]MDN4523168.1 DUF2238 domain-containing protein [Fictibacillus sp. NE201]
MPRFKIIDFILLAIIAAVFIWSAIQPQDYFTWVLEVSPAVVLLIILVITYHRFQLTALSYIILTVLMVLMFIGGHYTYDDVPLFEGIQKAGHFKRNEYDRFGHFLKGLAILPIREVILRSSGVKSKGWADAFSLGFIMTIAALYEIAEWLTAKIAGTPAKDFLGTQGDIWDSQWDMSLAFLGALLCLLLFSRYHNKMMAVSGLKPE